MAGSEKITRTLVRKLTQSKGKPVAGVVFAAVESDKLPLTSFAARAKARNQEVQAKLGQIMGRIAEWEAASGKTAVVAVRPATAAVAVTAPAALFERLAEDGAVAALDVDEAPRS